MSALFTLLCLASAPQSQAAAVAAFAEAQIGKREIVYGRDHYATDSVGLARAAFMSQGIDLFQTIAAMSPDRTGAEVVYQYAALNGRLHLRRKPTVGDLVFFGHTRDADNDGEADSVSHLGIVTALAADGTAKVVTASRTGVIALSLNRLRPKDASDELQAPLNSRFYIGRRFPTPKLASELFYTFATLAD